MPYESNSQLPEAVQNSLSNEDQTKWRKVFNSALDNTCDGDEGCAARVAWSQVKKNARYFAGWATSEIVDRQGDLIKIEAFKEAIGQFFKQGASIIDRHSNRKVGAYIDYEFRQKNGNPALWVEGVIYKGQRVQDEVWEKILHKEYPALSIGADPLVRSHECDETGKCWNTIEKIDLFEISTVDVPANPEATIEEVNHLAKSDTPERCQKRAIAALEKSMTVIQKMTWDECVRAVRDNPDVKDPEALCAWIREHKKSGNKKIDIGDSMAEPEETIENIDGGGAAVEVVEKSGDELMKELAETIKSFSERLDIIEKQIAPKQEEDEEEEEEPEKEEKAKKSDDSLTIDEIKKASLTIEAFKKAISESVRDELKKMTANTEADTPRPDLKKHELPADMLNKALGDLDKIKDMSISEIDAMLEQRGL